MKKAIFVTAGAAGTGFAIAERFAKEGKDVFVSARKIEEAISAAEAISAKYGVFSKGYAFDLRDRKSIVETFKDIDSMGYYVETVCHNAANLHLAKDPSKGIDFFDITPEEFAEVLEANVIGNFTIVREAALRMKENGGGAFVFISSNSAVRPNPNRIAYVTSKGGINSMSKSIAVDLGKYGIRSNVVMPGTIKTARWIAMGDKQISNGTMTPIGDISDFEDIANAAWFFGSQESKNVTGTELMVDGGMSTQIYPEILNKYRAEDIARQEATKK
ncbi:MAG: SDR family oxidoreductase [Clostridia bacterium]|nr:SDR family oxidoreductase [Clostridia bacterium]